MISDDIQVLEAMTTYGGGFIKKLAELASVADSENLAKLKHAFSNYWDEYRTIAEHEQTTEIA
jgi:hypothetical protein